MNRDVFHTCSTAPSRERPQVPILGGFGRRGSPNFCALAAAIIGPIRPVGIPAVCFALLQVRRLLLLLCTCIAAWDAVHVWHMPAEKHCAQPGFMASASSRQLLRSQPRGHLTLCVGAGMCGLAHLPAAVDPRNRPSSAADWQVACPTCSRSVA